MPTEEELTTQIKSVGDKIRQEKGEGKPKDDWLPLVDQLKALKIEYKEVTGTDYGPPSQEKKKKPETPPREKKKPENSGNQAPSEKNNMQNEESSEAPETKEGKKARKKEEKAAKEAQKKKNQEERAAREAAARERKAAVAKNFADTFGDAPMVQSKERTNKKWSEIENLTPELAGETVLVRGFLQTTRNVGKSVFVVVRSDMYTVQGICEPKDEIPKEMVAYIKGLPVESIVDMEGVVKVAETPVEACTQKTVEIKIKKFHCVTKTKTKMPFELADAMRPDEGKETDVGAYEGNDDAVAPRNDGMATVGLENRLDNRWVDLRTPANQGIFRIESMVGVLFREFLVDKKKFIELHSPKLIKGASEGGADVFTLDYFGQEACLSMSPQLHKQMACACAGFKKVFVTGPVFRAENSHTRRHLCEFTGFDMEMIINEHYDEILDVFSDLFIYIFNGINERCKQELEAIRAQHPFEDLKYEKKTTVKLTYAEGCKMLNEAGVEQDPYEDLSTENEKKLGDLVREKHGTDFFFLDKFPLAVRPFYTMPDPNNDKLSNSYDFFIRGQEILSGAQRIHEPELLVERAKAKGMDLNLIKAYINSFRNGAYPHGGGGIGLERVVMLFLGLPNIRKASWFPRDPKRLSP